MLHEVLLALSGHPSPLFSDHDANEENEDFPLLSPSEKALLASIGRLSELHRKLKRHLEAIASTHRPIACRAVATSVKQSHLSRFQQKIVDVESKILKRDSSMVGAYQIVPLATVVGEFDDWHRRMSWYWDTACFMLPPSDSGQPPKSATLQPCTSAMLIDRLRSECQTGYPEIEQAATQLTRVAETAWLRQLSGWVVYGKLPTSGAQDFFIRAEDSAEGQTFARSDDLLPGFVGARTASSLMFIGKSLHQVQQHRKTDPAASLTAGTLLRDSDIAEAHLKMLSGISLPITASQLSRTISDIRLSLSRSVLQHLLPMSVTLRVLNCLRLFFLLDHGDFAMALIAEAEDRLQARQQRMGKLLQQEPARAMQGLSMKDAELSQALTRVWKTMAAETEEINDDLLDYAQRHMTLSLARSVVSRPSTADSSATTYPSVSPTTFNDLLFPSASELGLKVLPPLDLFLSPRDVDTYSKISSYILSIRRGHHRLTHLWRRTPARRDHPISTAQDSEARTLNKERAIGMRKVWATCSAAIFLLSETIAFFEGEIIRGSCDHFQQWAEKPAPLGDTLDRSNANTDQTSPTSKAQRDPETLATGHRAFLASLIYALLLTDIAYTSELRALLGHIDGLVAFFSRLLDLQRKADGEREATGSESSHTAQEEKTAALELDRSRKRVDSAMKGVVGRLRQLDQERIGSARYLDVAAGQEGSDFEGWKGGGVDRLLMKLEFGRMAEEQGDAVLLETR